MYTYSEDQISFHSETLSGLRNIYFPLCGINASSLKASITPFLSGDMKTSKNFYLTKPVSREDLRYPVREFFLSFADGDVMSFSDDSLPSSVDAGMLWHKITKTHPEKGIVLESLNFIPVTGENAEIMRVTVKNTFDTPVAFTPTAAVPVFARSLSNKHDHEHVTALLNRIRQEKHGVVVKPTMKFNEEGHQANQELCFVLGCADDGQAPVGTFPTVDCFYGDEGSLLKPSAVYKNTEPVSLTDERLQGKEAVGALRFAPVTIKPGEEKIYIILIGCADSEKEMARARDAFQTPKQVSDALEANKNYWSGKSESISFQTGEKGFGSWMRWVTLQPVFRRIFGCSFLPDHDYGKGGKGWRDIWQDLLSLILIEPDAVKDVLINNFAGVRIDGSNATIIGNAPGEFIADRNAITRVWMDHGVWPFATLLLYIHQTGDWKILFEKQTYFRDPQLSRAREKDATWSVQYGQVLKDRHQKVYQGTLLEHILVQHLVQFFNVGGHNIARLENADWNDGLDMAAANGESVAFMSFYGGNLLELADFLDELSQKIQIEEVEVFEELGILLDAKTGKYQDIRYKTETLYQKYFFAVQPEVGGKKIKITLKDLTADLRAKGEWIFSHIKKQEKISVKQDGKTYEWFNGYYDNEKKQVEGKHQDRIRMTLTGQVFPIMSGLADAKEIEACMNSVSAFLKNQDNGGVRLNTDFGLDHYLSLGRAFGFAYGTKENGAVFSHMTVMYAYALYKRGFAREGYEVLHSLYRMSADAGHSKIFPGIPEYFDGENRGMYHYLTGSASWYVLTKLTQSFGIRGYLGDLVLDPKLVKEEFNAQGVASAACYFQRKRLNIAYQNPAGKDYGQYAVKEIRINQKTVDFERLAETTIKIPGNLIPKTDECLEIQAVLG